MIDFIVRYRKYIIHYSLSLSIGCCLFGWYLVLTAPISLILILALYGLTIALIFACLQML